MDRRLLRSTILLFALLPVLPNSRAAAPPDLDIRISTATTPSEYTPLREPTGAQLAAEEILRSRFPGLTLRWDGTSGAPKWLAAPPGSTLSAPTAATAEDAARAFLATHATLFGLEGREVEALELSSVSPASAGSAVYFKQRVGPLEVFDGRVNVNLNPDRSVRSVGSTLYAALRIPNVAAGDPAEAVRTAVRQVYPHLSFSGNVLSARRDGDRLVVFDEPGFGRPPRARLVLFPVGEDVRLVWDVRVAEKTFYTDYQVLLDVVDLTTVYRHNLTRYASARVLDGPHPEPESEEYAPDNHVLLVFPASTSESPSGWMSGDGTSLQGNNAVGHEFSWAGPVLTDPGAAYDYPFNNHRSALANAYWWTNQAHDDFYAAGFDEAAGNFQEDNFGLGGEGGDPLHVAQSTAPGRGSAYFSSSVDGEASTLNFGWLRCSFCGDHDGYPEDGGERAMGFSRSAVYHEFGHGVTTRMVGGPGDNTCLGGIQSSAMGEGWSDLFNAMFFDEPEQFLYIPEGLGWGRNLEHDLTYAELCRVADGGCQTHSDGMIWAGTLWDLRRSMIALDPASGGEDFQRLVIESLRSNPCGPTMLDARDAILDADTALFASAHHTMIWNAFASRGMGQFAWSPSDGPVVTENFTVPTAHVCPAPAAPTGLIAAAEGDNGVRLDFVPGTASAVEIWRDDLDVPHDGATLLDTTTDSTYLDDSVQGLKSYAYHLVGLGAGGVTCRSGASASASATAAGTCLSPPVFHPQLSIVEGAGDCTLTLSWDAATEGCPGAGEAVVYNVYGFPVPGFEPAERLLLGRTAETSFSILPPDDAQPWTYLVLAEHGSPDEAPSHVYAGSSQVLEWRGRKPALSRSTVHHWTFDTGDEGWTADNSPVSSGGWVRVDPVPTEYGGMPLAPGEPAGGSGMAWVTGDDHSQPDSIAEHDCDGPALLHSPVWDGTGGATLLSFDYWSSTFGGGYGGIELMIDNGTDTAEEYWIRGFTAQPFLTQDRYGWQRIEFDLADYVTPTTTMSVTFRPRSAIPVSEFGIDNVRVESGSPCNGSSLEIDSLTVDDSPEGWGNGNGVLEPGETARLFLQVANNGSSHASAPVGRLVFLPEGVLAHEPEDTFPDIPAGGTGTSVGNGFTVSVPEGQLCIETVNFEFEFVDAAGTRSVDLWSEEFGATVTDIVFFDDFSTDKGWQVEGAGVGGGIWQRGDPVGTEVGGVAANPEDCADGPGTLCYVTENGSTGGDPDLTDVDAVEPELYSPYLDFAPYKRTYVTFDYWQYENTGDPTEWEDYSRFAVYATAPFRESTIMEEFLLYPTSGWETFSMELTPEVPNVSGLQLCFSSLDRDETHEYQDATDHTVEMGVDNVEVTGDRQVCETPGIENPPNGIGDSLRVAKSAESADLSWTASQPDATHDGVAYYELWVSSAPDAGYSVVDTSTIPSQDRSLSGGSEYYAVVAVNLAGSSGDEPAP